jgi:EmrB/QacA subfamily drug resistance transporter
LAYSWGMDKNQKLVLMIAVLASFVALLDISVVNVALPAISRELGGGLSTQQWVVDAYLITLGSCILIAGSFSDIFGRKKVLLAGTVGFGLTSLLCALALNANTLIIMRGLQGIAGALLVPSSLALIISAFSGAAQGRAIGRWTAWTGIAFLIGPPLGGLLVQSVSWRLVFAINILPVLFVVWLSRRLQLAESTEKRVRVDVIGAMLCAAGLGLPVFALIEQPRYGWDSPWIVAALIIGFVCFGAFLWQERRTRDPMLPLGLFKIRNFWVGNIATTVIYAGLSTVTFLIAIFLQQLGDYTALVAGLALLPVTLVMFFLSPRWGALAGRFGPRLFMAAGPIIAAIGTLLYLRVGSPVNYLSDLLPAILIFALGLSITVSPLTAAILSSVPAKQAGIGSAVNNAVARIAGLIAIAFLGLLTGANLTMSGFHKGMILTAILLFLGGLISAIGIENPRVMPRKQAKDLPVAPS